MTRTLWLSLAALLAVGPLGCKDDDLPEGAQLEPASKLKPPPPPAVADGPPKESERPDPAEAEPAPVEDAPRIAGEEEGVLIEGTIEWSGPPTGVLNIDLMRKGPPAEVAYSAFNVGSVGPFKIRVPEDLGEVWIYAFLEGESKLRGGLSKTPIRLKSDDVAGVNIVLKDGFDLAAAGFRSEAPSALGEAPMDDDQEDHAPVNAPVNAPAEGPASE